MTGTVFINKGDVVGDKVGGNASIWHGTTAEYEALTDTDDNTFYNLEDQELKIPIKILEINAPLSEIGILDTLKNNEGYECSGFFYNTTQNVYCEFEGLYSGHDISGETVHFGYCHIRGIHNSEYSVDYYIDDEDGTTWYKKVPADYLRTEFSEINSKLGQTQKIFFVHSYTFGHNLSNVDHKVTVPLLLADTKSGFMKVCIMFSHVQDLYGKYEEYSISTNETSRYLTIIKTFEKERDTQYNNYTLTIGNDTRNVSFDLNFKITTGSSLQHILKVVIYY